MDAEREPALVLLERAEKAFVDNPVGERGPKRLSIELDAVLLSNGFDPEVDGKRFSRVLRVVCADRQ